MDYSALMAMVPENLKEIITFQTSGTKVYGKIAIGFGLAEKVGEEAKKLGNGKIFLVTDKTITGLGLSGIVLDSLQKAGFVVDVFDEVEPDPHLETALRVQDLVRKSNYGVVVGLGGGSVIDMAKVASLTATNTGDIKNYMTGNPIEQEGLPSIMMPTTSGTGSEVSSYIVLSGEDKKMFFASPYIYPTIALDDPLFTSTMPPKVTAATGLDALSHGVEGLIGKPGPISEALTNKCVEYVFNFLERACNNGEDLEARFYMSFASVLGMMSYTQGGGLYAHSCSYILALYNGTPHGMGCGVTLPYTLMFNLDNIKDVLVRFARIIDPKIQGSDEELAGITVQNFYDLLERVNMPNNLKDLGVNADFLTDFAKDLINKYYRVRNPRPMIMEEAEKLIDSMWHGELKQI